MSMDEPKGKIVETKIVSMTLPKGKVPLKAILAYNNEAHAVWDEGLAQKVIPGRVIRADVGAEPKGQYQNWTLYDFEVLSQPSVPINRDQDEIPIAVGPTVPQEVWDAKDRAIAMESALHSAAIVFQGTGKFEDVLGTADIFYDHIQETRRGAYLVPEVHLVSQSPVPVGADALKTATTVSHGGKVELTLAQQILALQTKLEWTDEQLKAHLVAIGYAREGVKVDPAFYEAIIADLRDTLDERPF